MLSLPLRFGGAWWLLTWPAASLAIAALAYLGLGPRPFGKRDDGRLGWPEALLLLPFLLFTWSVWHLGRWLGGEDASNEVSPGLWVGRRPFRPELPEGTTLVVDLTCEFPVHAPIRAEVDVVCHPTLDGTAPAAAGLEGVLQRILSALEAGGRVYVHCAAGHGRSATVAALVLLRRGLAADVDAAEALLRVRRPRIRLNRGQRALVRRLKDDPGADR